ncbi:MAG: hypothetical protein ACU0BN_19550 [Sulfitobacter sp.]
MGRNTWLYSILIVFVVAFMPRFALAVDYSWRAEASPFPTGPTAEAACRAYVKTKTTSQRYINHTIDSTGTGGVCYWGPTTNTSISYTTGLKRYGDSCSNGELDPATGGCSVPPGGQACVGSSPAVSGFGHITNSEGQCVDYVNADLPSQCKNLSGTSAPHTMYVSFDGDGNPLTPPPITAGGCAAVAAGVSHCVMAPKRVFPTGGSIQPTGNTCKVLVSFTGAVGGSGNKLPVVTGPSGDSDALCKGDCPPVDPAPIGNQTQPCTYVYDGEGRKVCSSSNFNYSPGNSSCGTVNGTFQCIGKAPTTNGIVIDTTVTDTTNPDGSKTSVKKDTATQIVCNSPKPCVSTTTTNTTTTNYNSNGAKTGQSTSCTGPACSADGKGDKDGDGLSDCAVGQCSEEEGVSVGAQDWHEKGDETFATAFEGFTSRVSSAPVMKAGDKFFAFNPSGSCPVWSVNTWVFSFTLDQHCSTDIPWDVIKAIIMACAGFVAFRWALL